METSDLKKIKEKLLMGQDLTPEEFEQLKEDHIEPMIETPSKKEENSSEVSEEKGKSYVKSLSGIPNLFSYDENQKSGFSNVLLLAIISFVSEILFLMLAFFLYQ